MNVLDCIFSRTFQNMNVLDSIDSSTFQKWMCYTLLIAVHFRNEYVRLYWKQYISEMNVLGSINSSIFQNMFVLDFISTHVVFQEILNVNILSLIF